MIREALKRRDKASPREQLYIDALAAEILPDTLHDKPAGSREPAATDPRPVLGGWRRAAPTCS